MIPIDAARRVLADAIDRRVFPAAAVEVGNGQGVLWREPIGTLTFDDGAPPVDDRTPFDLASLTKPIATTTAIMQLTRSGMLRLDERIGDAITDWRGPDRDAVTIRDLLEHASGLPARLLDPPPETAREFVHDIAVMPLEYPPRTRSIYSDLGFVLLGILASTRVDRPLARQFDDLRVRFAGTEPTLDTDPLTFDLADPSRAAPTVPLDEDARRGETLVGVVNDHYAAVLGPVSGHAGLFGTAASVGAFARLVLRAARGDRSVPEPLTPARVAEFTARTHVPGSSRALGWDTMLPTSSCGARMSAAAFGHVGFTGTSLWIDPDRDRYFVLLTNRACDGGTLEEMREVRRRFHDALAEF